VAAFIIFAALKMKELRQWELSLAASIVAMIPCISPCCILGLPIGIWALVVLLRPEVKEAFH
jgi:ABC-type proline/glycine betaine transport system permease subunit